MTRISWVDLLVATAHVQPVSGQASKQPSPYGAQSRAQNWEPLLRGASYGPRSGPAQALLRPAQALLRPAQALLRRSTASAQGKAATAQGGGPNRSRGKKILCPTIKVFTKAAMLYDYKLSEILQLKFHARDRYHQGSIKEYVVGIADQLRSYIKSDEVTQLVENQGLEMQAHLVIIVGSRHIFVVGYGWRGKLG
jgi:hypothetical protein